MDSVDAALELLGHGWNVVAAPRGGKSPTSAWKRWQTEAIPERFVREAFASGAPNLFVITGAVSRLLVLDCDNEAALKHWKAKLGPPMDQTTRVRTGNGYHFYFRLPEGVRVRGTSSTDPKVKWDIRAEGGGVIAPPSVHKTGRVYRWGKGRGPEALCDCPNVLTADRPDDTDQGQKSARSHLTELLTRIPEGEGGRNVWLARVCGHYAKMFLGMADAYDLHVDQAAAKLDPPLPEEEVYKTKQSIWDAELAKQGRLSPEVAAESEDWRANLTQPQEETGWLVSGRTCILVQVKLKKENGIEMGLARWMDADMRVIGVVESERGRAYEVEILRPDGDVVNDVLPSSVLSSQQHLSAWLANHGVTIGPPDNVSPAKMREPTRLGRYLEAQKAETLEAADALGWHEPTQAFITHEGVIRAKGASPHERVRPDPIVRGWAPYRYGMGGTSEASAILTEVLTFHDETVAAVFGSWWAACLLKPQIQRVASQFPFMALEAASESGKTTGFFSIMLQLAGNSGGHSNPTRAALRDYLSAHHSGIVWMDDLDSLEAHGELLRNVTVGGSIIKKGEDNAKQVVAQMRAALVVSGESLGLHGQKALIDRAILLEVPSPTKRKSLKGDYPQWDDILDLRQRHPDLNDYAGSIVQLALQQEGVVSEYKSIRRGSGRYADKIAVVELGARILEGMLSGAEWIPKAVETWAYGIEDSGAENALTLKLLPLALSRTGWKSKPEGPDQGRRMVATPVFVEDADTIEPVVWFSPSLLAAWWEREPPAGKRLDPRVESAEALTQQARALGFGGKRGPDGGRRPFRLVTGEGTQVYWRATTDMSQRLLNRSRGGGEDNG